MIDLYPYQQEAVERLKNGSILCGGVGSGKSITSLAYYFKTQKSPLQPQDLYIITTARKRDTLEWEGDMTHFLLSPHPEVNGYSNKVVVDSWNNIKKYENVKDSFFIFDEQRVVGSGAWVKSFIKIAKANQWILLSATPGDTWLDYIPVFIANGFYRTRTEFYEEHVAWKYNPYAHFRQVDRYLNTGRLIRLRNQILVEMAFERKTVAHHEDIYVEYDPILYKSIFRDRWNIWEDRPIETASELCYALRRVTNSDVSRIVKVMEIVEKHGKAIIFYNFDYELEILKEAYYGPEIEIAEWNGHKHQPIPSSDKWVYLVQYTSGAEGWNCVSSDTIIFFSQNYSYKTMVQSAGRIDRLNTKYIDLYYYHLKSRSSIDIAISRAVKQKKRFNETAFAKIPN